MMSAPWSKRPRATGSPSALGERRPEICLHGSASSPRTTGVRPAADGSRPPSRPPSSCASYDTHNRSGSRSTHPDRRCAQAPASSRGVHELRAAGRPRLRPRQGRGRRGGSTPSPATPDSSRRSEARDGTARSRAQGYVADAAYRRAVEIGAMAVAIAHYESVRRLVRGGHLGRAPVRPSADPRRRDPGRGYQGHGGSR